MPVLNGSRKSIGKETVPGAEAPADEELVRRAQADPDQFSALYERYAKDIERFMLARTNGHRDLAEDLASQVFTRAYTALPRYNAGSFRGWLYQIARNTLIDTYRRQRPTAPLDAAWAVRSDEPPLDERVIAAEARQQLHDALGLLAEPQRAIILLRLQGLTGREIADRLGMSHDAMRSAQYRAMGKLRIALQHLHETDIP
jgi:RNA polymerase sigma-70 factor (ECF subfamily)